MKFQRRQIASRGQIDLTPIIDCVFQLLLFFLVAANFDEEARLIGEGELLANLPQAAAALPMVAKPLEMFINIDHRGRFIVSGDVLDEPQLAEQLRRAHRNNPGNQSVIIRGDEHADWKYIARVMSLCNKANIRDYRVAVIPPNE